MTRHNPAPAAKTAAAEAPASDPLVALYEHEALRLMLRCLYRQFYNEENAAAVRTAATLLKCLPAARRGCDWIDALDAIERDFSDEHHEDYEQIEREFAWMTPEEKDAEILEASGVGPEAAEEVAEEAEA
ncbi:hypothetical protein [Maricaulis sp.]|uniref:hypothetical protein n=1 Tax=Maricaulis sp. TaxID=1486257 RepID=UPI003A91242B